MINKKCVIFLVPYAPCNQYLGHKLKIHETNDLLFHMKSELIIIGSFAFSFATYAEHTIATAVTIPENKPPCYPHGFSRRSLAFCIMSSQRNPVETVCVTHGILLHAPAPAVREARKLMVSLLSIIFNRKWPVFYYVLPVNFSDIGRRQ